MDDIKDLCKSIDDPGMRTTVFKSSVKALRKVRRPDLAIELKRLSSELNIEVTVTFDEGAQHLKSMTDE